jgi:hypothetical protein
LSSRRTRIPDFDRLVNRSGHDLGPVRGKRHRHDVVAVGVGLLAQHLQLACQTSQQASVLAEEGRFEGNSAPKSQTLIVLSSDPDTILVPSGENATDLIQSLWAFVFSLNSSSLSARQANRRQFWPRRGDFGLAAHPNPRLSSSRHTIPTQSWFHPGKMPPTRWLRCGRSSSRSAAPARLSDKPTGVSFGQGGAILSSRRTRIPDFDRLVVRSGHNLGPVWGKRHRPDGVAVSVRLLAQHLQLVCQASQQASVLAKEGRF